MASGMQRSINLRLPLRASRATTAATVVVHSAAAVPRHSPVLHLACTACPRGVIPADLSWLEHSTLHNRNPNLHLYKNSKVSVFRGIDQTGESGVVSDAAGAAKAKSQQIRLLSPTISLRNWRLFVSFRWQQIWKHYVQKSLGGKKTVWDMTKIYRCS